MNTNLGAADRLMRASIGLLILVGVLVSEVSLFTYAPLYYGAIALGVIALLNSVTGTCLIFKLTGLNTCPKSRKAEHTI